MLCRYSIPAKALYKPFINYKGITMKNLQILYTDITKNTKSTIEELDKIIMKFEAELKSDALKVQERKVIINDISRVKMIKKCINDLEIMDYKTEGIQIPFS